MKHLIMVLILVLGPFSGLSGQGIVEEYFSFDFEACSFNATISRPAGTGPFPAIVLIPGSGQNDRNGTINLSGGNSQCLYPGLVDSSLTIYKDLAQGLSAKGYLVLRYDELFISCPNTSTPVNSYEKLWLPAQSAIDSLAVHPLVNAQKLYLMGHSEGASLINYIASQRNDLTALVNIAGAYTPFDSLLARQLVEIANLCGGNVNAAQMQANQILSYFNALRNGTNGLPDFAGATAAAWMKYINVNDSVLEYYRSAQLPSLFLGMANDFNVPGSEWQRFKDSLDQQVRNEFYQLNGLNHYMTPDSLARVDQRVIDTIHYFLSREVHINLTEPKKQGHLEVYPNPSKGKIWIKGSHDLEGKALEIHDLNGKLRQQVRLKDKLELDLPPGRYLVQCAASNEIIIVKP